MNELIFKKNQKNQYIYDNSDLLDLSIDEFLSDKKNNEIRIPIVIDSEFWDDQRKCATVQIKGIKYNKPVIFAHPDLKNYAIATNRELRHYVTTSEFCVIDYLNFLGYNASIISKSEFSRIFYNETKKYPVIQFDIYSHFALAELLMIFQGKCKEDMINIITQSKYPQSKKKIELGRRLRTYTKDRNNKQVMDAINLPWIVNLEGIKFKVRLRFIDTCAIHGIASYADLCDSCGIKLDFKDKLTQKDKESMNETYFINSNYDAYALGDLEVYNILEVNSNNFRKIYEDLDIIEYFKHPNLTIGSTVQNVFKAVLYKHFGIDNDDKDLQDKLIEFCRYGSASIHKLYTDTSKCLLAKVNGGRCRNNRPLTSYLEGTIVDADISSAYATALRNQVYPIGRPIIEDFDNRLDNNHYLTLKEWLKHRKYNKKNSELIDGLWQLVVSNKQDKNGNYETLEISQDFIISWFDFRYDDIREMNTDNDNQGNELNVKTGKIKIFNKQIINGVITSDILELIMRVCTPKQKNELLDKLYVKVACYYPKYSKIQTFEDLIDADNTWNEENVSISKKKHYKSHKLPSGQIIKIVNVPSYWIGLNIASLLVDKLLSYRLFYKLKDGKKSPLQTLFKLINNTLYGDFCSPYFDISNTIVGNNITAKVRCMSWYMEKSLYGIETITDGTQFDVNEVCYPSSKNRRLNGLNTVNLYAENKRDMRRKREIILKPLGNYDKIEHFYEDTYIDDKGNEKKVIKLKLYKNGEVTIIENSAQWLNEIIFKHIQREFNVSILHKKSQIVTINENESLRLNKPIIEYKEQIGLFSIEIKNIYDYGCFHGASNYLLNNQNETIIKMRSYESNKNHYTFELTENNELIETNFYDESVPSEMFLTQLSNSYSIKRSKPFKKKSILKINEFKNNSEKWLELGFVCGDTIEKAGMLKELSLSQFTYLTMIQYLTIEKEYERNKRKFEQSYEGFFLNEDNTLNYQEMIKTLNQLIRNGIVFINSSLDEHRNRQRDIMIKHPDHLIYQFLKDNQITIKNDFIIIDENFNPSEYDEYGEETLDDNFVL